MIIFLVIFGSIAFAMYRNVRWQIRHEEKMHEMRMRHVIWMQTRDLRSAGVRHLRVVK